MPAVLKEKALPAPNGDFYSIAESLEPDEIAVVKKVRAFMEAKVAPIIDKYWADDAFPFELGCALQRTRHRRSRSQRLWLCRRQPEAVRLCCDGDGAHRSILLHILRRA
ncbi:MAG: hypothetical protein WDM89_06330 [Rhizomicrobium sp.]